ncbi:MAG: CDP-alcohol phosphatidyltransferase family protein [Verrucomicrobiota bacterium]
MTLANKITLSRIGMIPIFVASLMYYQESARDSEPQETFRWFAVGTFLIASVSDAFDGFIARRFNQQSRLGEILDPLADKGLLLATLISLSALDISGFFRIPIWFFVLVVSRDVLLISGVAILHLYGDSVRISPHWSGRISTFVMMFALSAILLKLPSYWCNVLIAVCGFFTSVSVIVYLLRGVNLLSSSWETHSEGAES